MCLSKWLHGNGPWNWHRWPSVISIPQWQLNRSCGCLVLWLCSRIFGCICLCQTDINNCSHTRWWNGVTCQDGITISIVFVFLALLKACVKPIWMNVHPIHVTVTELVLTKWIDLFATALVALQESYVICQWSSVYLILLKIMLHVLTLSTGLSALINLPTWLWRNAVWNQHQWMCIKPLS